MKKCAADATGTKWIYEACAQFIQEKSECTAIDSGCCELIKTNLRPAWTGLLPAHRSMPFLCHSYAPKRPFVGHLLRAYS